MVTRKIVYRIFRNLDKKLVKITCKILSDFEQRSCKYLLHKSCEDLASFFTGILCFFHESWKVSYKESWSSQDL